jgi:hypothetical protein
VAAEAVVEEAAMAADTTQSNCPLNPTTTWR